MEAKLPSLKRTKSVDAKAVGSRIEQAHQTLQWPIAQKSPEELLLQLAKYGLKEWEAQLVLGRVVEGKTLEAFGWESEGSVRYHLRRIFTLLRKAGFKFEG